MTTWAATITSVGSSENLYTLEVGIEKLLDAKRSPLEHFVNPKRFANTQSTTSSV